MDRGVEDVVGDGDYEFSTRCPKELLVEHIWEYLDISSLLKVRLVCRNWRRNAFESLQYLDMRKIPPNTSFACFHRFVGWATKLKKLKVSSYVNEVNWSVISTQLESITFKKCPKVDFRTVANTFPHLTKLETIGCDKVTSTALKSFPTKLVSLSLENCTRIKDESLIEYSTLCTSLKHLNLKGCYKLRDRGIIAMAKSSTKLESLSLNKLRQAVNLDSINIILDSCSQLKSLNLLSCSVTDSCLQSISTKLGFNLTSLRIKFCNEVTDEGMRSICLTCLNLEVIDIQGLQKITNATMESISKCDSLVELDLRDCPQIDSGLDKILDNCTYLQVLRMRSPQIRDETISPLIHKGSYLKIIDFQSCINLSFGCIMSLASAQKVHLRRFIIHEIPLDQDQVTELTSIAPFEVTLSLQTPNGLLNVFWNSKIQ